MKPSIPLTLLAAATLAASTHAVTLVDPTFSGPDGAFPNVTSLTPGSSAGDGWYTGYASRHSISAGEGVGPAGSPTAHQGIGQIVQDAKASLGLYTFSFNYDLVGVTGGVLNWVVVGTDSTGTASADQLSLRPEEGVAPDLALPTNSIGANWTVLGSGSAALSGGTVSGLSVSSSINLGASGYEYIGVRLTTDGLAGTTRNIQWDNVAFTAIPEPATVGLIAGGLALALVGFRRRR